MREIYVEYLRKDAANLRMLIESIASSIVSRLVSRTKIMALHAAAVEILIEKARFEPQIALGIAEAIEATIMHAQLLTVPVLGARMQELRAETRISLMAIESKLSTFNSEVGAKIQGIKSDIGQSRAELEVKMEATKAELEVKVEAIKAELVRWVFLAMLGNVALSAGASAALKYLG
jgi:hypothetical protein